MTAAALAAIAALTQQPGPAVGVMARIEPDTALLGQPVELIVSLTDVPLDAEIIYPNLPDSGTVTPLSTPRPVEREGTVRSVRYRIAGWALGDLPVALDDIVIVAAAGELRVPGPRAVVHVSSTLPRDAEADTLSWRPPADVLGPNWSVAERAAAIALALAILAVTAAYVRRRRVPKPVPLPPRRPPRERALEALDRLEESGLLTAGEFKAVHSELSGVLRRFLAETDARWGLDLTTVELLPVVAKGGVGGTRLASLGGILTTADMVKFARRESNRQRAGRLLDSTRLWIREFQRMPAGTAEPEVSDPDGGVGSESLTDVTALMTDFFADLDAASLDDEEGEMAGPEDGRGGGSGR